MVTQIGKEKKMKSTKMLAILVLGLMVCSASVSEAEPIGTAFTYQGFLMDKNNPANDTYDFEFELYDALADGNQLGDTNDVNDLEVTDGYFSVELDFGTGIFTGERRWLETTVAQSDGSDPCTLEPRLEVTLTPYAIYAKTAGSVPGGITGSGTVGDIVRFTGPNTIGDSIIVQSGGNVGVGLMNPSQRLDVAGFVRIVHSNPSILLYDVNGPLDDRYFMLRATNQNLEFTTLDYSMAVEQQAMVIDNTGNIGIGTTNPSERLHVAGSIRIVDGNEGQDRVLTSDANGVGSWQEASGLGVGVMPVGGVVAWLKSYPNTPALPSNFVECNGQTLNDPNSAYDGQTIPDLNGSSRFLRGSATSGTTGGSETHTHSIATNTQGENRAGSENNNAAWKEHNHGGGTGSQSTLPSYYEVVWIMRVK